MRGAGDQLSIGERVAFYRRRRGLSQAVLAGLVGRTEDWPSKIERGERQVNRVDVLVDLAQQLRVTLNDLLGEPLLFERDNSDDDVPAVRDALMSPQRLSRRLFAEQAVESVGVGRVSRMAEEGWNQYQNGSIGHVIGVLPMLLEQARLLESDVQSTAEVRRSSWAASARVHHLAATTLSKIGEADLAWIAAERAMHAADGSEDPLAMASAARAATHSLLVSGRFDEAVRVGEAAARLLEAEIRESNPEALSLYGMLFLRTALAAARRRDRRAAEELLMRAEVVALRLGEDGNHWQTGFGQTNVELHRLAAWIELGAPKSVVERGARVRPDGLPAERQATHAIDMARSTSMLARDDEAVGLLLGAEQQAPDLVRHSSSVREVVRTMYRRSPVSSGKTSALMGLAERCRAVR